MRGRCRTWGVDQGPRRIVDFDYVEDICFIQTRVGEAQDPLDLVLAAPSASVAQPRAELLSALLESAGLEPALLEIEPIVGPAALDRRPATTHT